MELLTAYRLPLGDGIEWLVLFLSRNLRAAFDALSVAVRAVEGAILGLLALLPAPLVIAALAALAWRLAGRGLALFTLVALPIVYNLELWPLTLETVALTLTASLLCLTLGIPLGILQARSGLADMVMRPLLDFVQTMPAFVYLIPAVMFFGLGPVPGIIATVIFAVALPIRLTNLGLRQVPVELTEAGEAFGCSRLQLLFKVQVPMAMPSIMAGVNQTIMMCLSMVIIAAMIGAGGLGGEVLRGIQRMAIGRGFEGGLAVVVTAILLDRLTQGLARLRVGRPLTPPAAK
jgi:glycine betaine/proline transport system permease protein